MLQTEWKWLRTYTNYMHKLESTITKSGHILAGESHAQYLHHTSFTYFPHLSNVRNNHTFVGYPQVHLEGHAYC